MKNVRRLLLVAPLLLVASGCAHMAHMSGSANPYRDVDLSRDLDAATLERYNREIADAHAGGGHGGHMMTLERSNWWPLGLVAYWRSGSARMMHSDAGYQLMVSQSRGYGPLAMLWASGEQAVYGSDGKRLMYMAMDSAMFGHLAMFHKMGAAMPDGSWMEHQSGGVFHHMFNFATGHGGASYSLFSMPNPVGIE